jgi:hypothetical protein
MVATTYWLEAKNDWLAGLSKEKELGEGWVKAENSILNVLAPR